MAKKNEVEGQILKKLRENKNTYVSFSQVAAELGIEIDGKDGSLTTEATQFFRAIAALQTKKLIQISEAVFMRISPR